MRDLPLPTFPISDLSAASAPRRSLHRREPTARAPESDKNHFEVVWARDEEDVRQAQRLRRRVKIKYPNSVGCGDNVECSKKAACG